MNWLDILKVVVTVILPLIHPKLAAVSPLILQGITDAESFGGSGADKLASVVKLVNDGVAVVNAASGKIVIDPTLVSQTSAAAISAAVDITNLIAKTPVPSVIGGASQPVK